MEPSPKLAPETGLSLRTALWLAGSAFILAASGSFVAYLRFEWPWWTLVLMLGTAVGAVVTALEHALARPLERLAKSTVRVRDGVPLLPPAPGGLFTAPEFRRLWRTLRVFQDLMAQARLAREAAEGRLTQTGRQLRILDAAGRSLRPDVALADVAPGLLTEVAGLLGVPDVYLVPLRRHCAIPVLGGKGEPGWGPAVRATGLAPWEGMLAGDRPLALCVTPLAPAWHSEWGRSTVWVVPLNYHGRAQGMLVAFPTGTERTWTSEELALFKALGPILAASLHPPRWSDERRIGPALPEVEPPPAELELEVARRPADEEPARRTKRRRQRQGA